MEAKALTAAGNDKLLRQPIFCFETMMHMLYWSCLVYDYKRVSHLHRIISTSMEILAKQGHIAHAIL